MSGSPDEAPNKAGMPSGYSKRSNTSDVSLALGVGMKGDSEKFRHGISRVFSTPRRNVKGLGVQFYPDGTVQFDDQTLEKIYPGLDTIYTCSLDNLYKDQRDETQFSKVNYIKDPVNDILNAADVLDLINADNSGNDKLEIVTAVVVADSFNQRFMPLTLDKPRCLLPLLNVPLIEYTLEFLAISGMQEVFVKLKSVGDALRDLDGQRKLSTDFVLVSGDVVSNLNLKAALDEHRSKGEEGLYVLDANTHECVHYDSLYPKKKKLKINAEIFKKHPEVQVRNDLIDCQIDICSLDVPALFTENFDWQDIRRGFVRGVLESDLLGKQIHCHIIADDYAARVRSTQMYDAISKDMLARWTFPIVPDSNITGSLSYSHSRPHIYKEKNVVLSRTAKLDRHVAIGKGTEVGERSVISHSVIGQNCKIGANVVIEGSYIWDNVTIGDNCRIYRSIVASGVVIKNNVNVQKGSILSFGVVIGQDFEVREFSRLTKTKRAIRDHDDDDEDEDEDEDEDANTDDIVGESDPSMVGNGGIGFVWNDNSSNDDDEENFAQLLEVCSMAREIDLHKTGEDEEESDESDLESEVDEAESEIVRTAIEKDFFTYPPLGHHREILATLERGFDENHTIENILLELNTLKFGANLEFRDLRLGAVPATLNLVSPSLPVKEVLKRWGAIMTKLVLDHNDQLDILRILESHCTQREDHAKLFLSVLQYLYQEDAVEEDAIIKWYNSTAGKIHNLATPFINWLSEAEEEESD
ncbi:hypothetical protein HDU76_003615 [Blyttiomyces sp. JEL0837]|nr:hypothetical protein HDU76_003615 [Blyttiomyces sp. JEL0837]